SDIAANAQQWSQTGTCPRRTAAATPSSCHSNRQCRSGGPRLARLFGPRPLALVFAPRISRVLECTVRGRAAIDQTLAPYAALVVGVLNNTHPLWVAIVAVVWQPSRRPAWLIAGSLVALVGVVLVFLPDLVSGATGGFSATSAIGAALALAGSGVIALSTLVG